MKQFVRIYSKWFILLGILTGIIIVSSILGESILENKKPLIESFIIINFLGYLFFLMMPIEGLYLYYLTLDFNWIHLLPVAIITAMMGQFVNFILGTALPEKYIAAFSSEKKYKKRKQFIQKYGNLMVLVFSLSILSSPIIVLIAGFVKCNWKGVFLYSLIGLSIKYIAITLFYILF